MLSHYWKNLGSSDITNLIAGRLENGLCGKVVYRQRPNDLSITFDMTGLFQIQTVLMIHARITVISS